MQHELLTPLSDQQLAECIDKVPDDYPDPSLKLVLTPDQWRDIEANGFVISEGAWTISDHPRRREINAPLYNAENPVPPEMVAYWHRIGLRTDAVSGLPIHPRAEQLLTTPGLGMFTQVGSFYRPGPNPVTNMGLRRVRGGVVEYAAVAVRRGRSLCWGLPGGFYDPDTDPDLVIGAFREAREEIGIRIGEIGSLLLQHYDDDPQYAWAATVHAWMQESYYFAQSLSNPALEGFEQLVPEDRNEIVDAAWLTFQAMANPELRFMGTHLRMTAKHERTLQNLRLS